MIPKIDLISYFFKKCPKFIRLYLHYFAEAVTSASFTKDGQCVVTSCADATVRLTDKATGELLNE
jgi:WD40 repeat protein